MKDKIQFLNKMYEICHFTDDQIIVITTFQNQKMPKIWEDVMCSNFLDEQRSLLRRQRDNLKKLFQEDFLLLK